MVPIAIETVETVRVEDFDFPRLPQGCKERFNLEIPVATHHAGLFFTRVQLLDRVTRGQIIGEVTDLLGRVLEEFRANSDGVVELIRSTTRVFPGEILFLISPEAEG